MGRYTGPKNKLSRREGIDLFNKGEKLRRSDLPPGYTGKKLNKKLSEFGKQLRSKQTAKRMYGVYEKQFVNYVSSAIKTKGDPSDNLINLLEKRLDNIVYRSGWLPTRPAARQMVSHGHVLVNGKKLNIPSYNVKPEDVVSLEDKVREKPVVIMSIEEKRKIPDWLQVKGFESKVVSEPGASEVEGQLELRDIIEFYSR